jgi:hypothetical protein
MTARHPEVPDDSERDHSLFITEAQQRELLETITEIEHDVRKMTFEAMRDTPANRAAAEEHLARLTLLSQQTRDAISNVVTVEERIAHLDFDMDADAG